jgi:hypothetical protein
MVLVTVALAWGAVLAGVLAGELVSSGHAFSVFAVAAVALPVVAWKKPSLAPVLLVVLATTIEQDPYMVGPYKGAFTDRVPLFAGLGRSAHVNPADLLFVLLVLIWVLKVANREAAGWPRSATGRAVLALLGAVALGLATGTAHHGDLRSALMEVRPYAYLAMTFALTAGLIATKAAIRPVLWGLVLGSGFKSAQGIVLFLHTRHLEPRPEAVLGHEEAFFFGLFVFLTLGLWLFDVRGALRATATALMPFVVVADMANSRRTAWLILGAGLLVFAAVGYVSLPGRRRLLRRCIVVGAILGVVYVPAFWNHTGSLGQPARAVHSIVSPDSRDAASNLYRKQENANLKLNIRKAHLIGKGFGVRIDYALPIVDISKTDPLIAYIPHNGVLYVIMRMGVIGGIAFWSLLAVGLINACRLAKSGDRELALIGVLVACGLVTYAVQGYNDQGFFFYRIAFVTGALLGLGDVASRLAARPTVLAAGES